MKAEVLFLSVFIYPLNSIFRRTEIGFKEIILASPATAGDIFVGEFIGRLPIYLGGILLFTPIIIIISESDIPRCTPLFVDLHP